MHENNNTFWNRDAVFIVGVRKCGTTTVFDYLSQFENDLCPSKLKEPQYFALADMKCVRAQEWYTGLFDKSERAILDGSTWLITDPQSIRNIREKFKGKVSVITMQRNPINRAISAYQHMRKKGGDIETRTFSQVLSDIEKAEGADLWTKENNAILTAEKEGKIDTNYCDKSFLNRRYGVDIDCAFHDKYAMFRYFGESIYQRYFDNIKSVEGDINWLHLNMEAFIKDEKEKQKLLDFLNIEAKAKDYSLFHSNKTVNNRHAINIKEKHPFLYKAVKTILPSETRKKFKGLISQKTDIIRNNDYERAEKLFNKN